VDGSHNNDARDSASLTAQRRHATECWGELETTGKESINFYARRRHLSAISLGEFVRRKGKAARMHETRPRHFLFTKQTFFI